MPRKNDGPRRPQKPEEFLPVLFGRGLPDDLVSALDSAVKVRWVPSRWRDYVRTSLDHAGFEMHMNDVVGWSRSKQVFHFDYAANPERPSVWIEFGGADLAALWRDGQEPSHPSDLRNFQKAGIDLTPAAGLGIFTVCGSITSETCPDAVIQGRRWIEVKKGRGDRFTVQYNIRIENFANRKVSNISYARAAATAILAMGVDEDVWFSTFTKNDKVDGAVFESRRLNIFAGHKYQTEFFLHGSIDRKADRFMSDAVFNAMLTGLRGSNERIRKMPVNLTRYP